MTITASSLAKKAACTLLAGGLAFAFAFTVSASNTQQAFAVDDGYTYCYAGLSWAEYWAGEDVYEAGNDASSDAVDTSGQSDCGAFDVVSRATVNHGLHRGSYQCNATIHATATDGTTRDFAIATWASDGKSFTTTDGTVVSYNRGECTVDDVTYTLESYDVYGTKYVPVKVKTSDYEAFKANREAAGYTVTEDGGTLAGGYSENVLKAYSVTADVNANTHGLKTATKNSDGSFSFSAADESVTGSGIEGQSSLKKVTETTYDAYLSQVQAKAAGTSTEEPSGIYVAVAGSEKGYSTPSVGKDGTVSAGSQLNAGSYGELIRVDLCGDYGDLGAAMQSVTWTYYGNDSTGKKVVRKFGTKFAADNWMHKSMDIQLGLTDSIRCQFPEGYDGTGYWAITVHALGYEDYTTSLFQITKDNFSQTTPASEAILSELKTLVKSCSGYVKANYTAESWANLQTELSEANELLADEGTLYVEVSEQIEHVKNAVSGLSATAKANKVTLKSKKANVKYKKVKKAKQTLQIKASAKGKATISYASSSKNVAVSKKGKVTIKKGTKKGTYKVTVSAKEVKGYLAASTTYTIKVK